MQRFACGQCGIEFDVPDHFARECHEKGNAKTWYCPNGHQRVFRDSDSDKFRRERDQAVQRLAQAEADARAARQGWEKAERELTRQHRRAAAGTCPCCQRTFTNMARHMKTKHPAFITTEPKAAMIGRTGGLARAAKLAPERRHEIATTAARTRWAKNKLHQMSP